MADKLLIAVSADQATAGLSRNGKLGACRVFHNDPAGLEAFGHFLGQFRNVPAHVLLDVVEEDYRFEMLPHTGGRDRTELVERRLRQLYRNTPYSGALLQGRDTGKRRDDQYLFFALLNPELLNVWLASVRSRNLPVAGVYLLPVVAEHVARKIAPQTANVLLVMRHPSGLRLSFFRDGKLRVSRLTQLVGTDPQRSVAEFTEEIANTRLYLHALRVMTLDEQLTVVAIERDHSLDGLEQAVAREVSNAQALVLGPGEVAQRLGVPAAAVTEVSDALYVHLVASLPLHGNLAPEPVTEQFQIYQLRRALYATAGVAALASLGGLGFNAFQLYDLKSQQTHAAVQTAEYQRRYQEVTRRFPAAPTSAENLVAAVQVAERLRAAKRTPESVMALLGRVLDQSPNVRLKAVGWKYAPRERDDGPGQHRSEAQASNPDTPDTHGRRQSAFIEAEIYPFDGDYRAALGAIDDFTQRLREDPAVADIKVAALPLNVSPTMALTGSTSENPTRATNAPFRLDIALKPTR